jgi:HEAT repeat protein
MRLLLVAVLATALLVPFASAQSTDAEQLATDQQILKQANVEVDDAGLLEYFRKRTLRDADRENVRAMVRKLGDEVFVVRNRTTNDLIAMGTTARPALQEVLNDPDLEIARRATSCLDAIEKGLNPAASQAAARMLARRKSPGATEALLGFLPFAEDESVADETRAALTALAVRDGKPDKVLLDATADRLPVRRAAAVEALLRGKAMEPAEGRKYLTDADATVRLAAALALAQRHEKEAVPVLIALLTELPRERAWQIEDVLCRLAGEQAPAVSLGSDDTARQQCRDAWAGWWQKNAEKADLTHLSDGQRMLGFTVVTALDQRNTGKVYEIGMDGKVRWKIDKLQFPMDAQVLPGERVLIAEMNGNRVTERDFKGKVLWEKNFPMPLSVQRLPNGNTFVAGRNGLVEYDRAGKEVFKHERGDYSIFGGVKLRNGEYGMVTQFGTFVRLDARRRACASLTPCPAAAC